MPGNTNRAVIVGFGLVNVAAWVAGGSRGSRPFFGRRSIFGSIGLRLLLRIRSVSWALNGWTPIIVSIGTSRAIGPASIQGEARGPQECVGE